MSDQDQKKDSKAPGTMENIKSSDVIVSKPNNESQTNKNSKVNKESKVKKETTPSDSKVKSNTPSKDIKQSKDQSSKSFVKDPKKSKELPSKTSIKDTKEVKPQDHKEESKVLNNSKAQEVKHLPKENANPKKTQGKGEAKLRNLLKDPRVLQDVENLFEDLKGSKSDDFVDSSTILFLFNMLEVSKTEPEYYWYIYTQIKDVDKLSKTQFIELFMNPPEYKPNDVEDIRNLFQIFDVKEKGSFSKNDFIEFFKFSPIYQSNPELVEDNLEKCFDNIQKIFGNREITPVEFYQIINQNKTND